jgi:ABC-type branched-subunit amino acid transport system ATPase component
MTDAGTPVVGTEPAAPPSEELLLSTQGVTKSFGGLLAVSDINFSIPERGIVSIIGPNGAGKTTFFNMLTGLYRPTSGTIFFRGRDITRVRPDRITALGIARTFQNIRLFGTMTALENVLVGEHARMRAGLIGSILRIPRVFDRGSSASVRSTSPTAISDASRSRAHWHRIRRCFYWMNPPPA